LNEGASAILTYGEGQEVLEELRTIVYSLPTPNFELFKLLVWFFIQIDANSDKNKMHANNLLRVMTPTLHVIPGFITIPMEHFDYFFGDGTTYEDGQQNYENGDGENQSFIDTSDTTSTGKSEDLSSPLTDSKSITTPNVDQQEGGGSIIFS